jgi:hypothetical protein
MRSTVYGPDFSRRSPGSARKTLVAAPWSQAPTLRGSCSTSRSSSRTGSRRSSPAARRAEVTGRCRLIDRARCGHSAPSTGRRATRAMRSSVRSASAMCRCVAMGRRGTCDGRSSPSSKRPLAMPDMPTSSGSRSMAEPAVEPTCTADRARTGRGRSCRSTGSGARPLSRRAPNQQSALARTDPRPASTTAPPTCLETPERRGTVGRSASLPADAHPPGAQAWAVRSCREGVARCRG